MPAKGKHAPRQDLTAFGEWFYIACDLMRVNTYDVANRSGVERSTLSKATRIEQPRRETVEKIVKAFESFAVERGIPWQYSYMLYHAAGYSTLEEEDHANYAAQQKRLEVDRQK